MNVVAPIVHQARIRPNAPALISADEIISFGQLNILIQAAAARLIASGIRPADVVSISLGNSPLHLILMFALARIGAITVPKLKGGADQVRADAIRLGCAAVCHRRAVGAIEGVRSIIIDSSWRRPPNGETPVPEPISTGASNWRIATSSGTTGKAKMIPMSHAGTLMRAFSSAWELPAGPGHRMLLLLNLNASFALHSSLAQLYAGGALVLTRISDSASLLDTVNRFQITNLITSPFMATKTLSENRASGTHMPSLNCVLIGGGILSEPLRRMAESVFSGDVICSYGSTETGNIALGDLPALAEYPDAVGRVLPSAAVQVVDEHDRPLPSGAEGVIRVRTLGMATEYYNDPALTEKAYRDGWFYPGDIGAVTDSGIVRISGRSDEIVNLGGAKIAPALIERALDGFAQIRDFGIAALAEADAPPSLGVGIVADAQIDYQRIIDRCRAVLPAQVQVHVVSLPAIPRNSMGKVLRHELAATMTARRTQAE